LSSAKKYDIKQIYTSKPTTKTSLFENMEVIGRYVVLNTISLDFLIQIIASNKTRCILLCKRMLIRCLKAILGDSYITIKNKLIRQ